MEEKTDGFRHSRTTCTTKAQYAHGTNTVSTGAVYEYSWYCG